MTSCNRICPSVEGSASPLITHRIGVDVCFARQRTFFHKCHRCIYREKPANWEPENTTNENLVLQPIGESVRQGVTEVELPLPSKRPAASKPKAVKGGKAKPGKARPGKTVEADA